MDTNDRDIAEKRRELDKLKKHYEFTKSEHKEQEDKLKEEIGVIRTANKKTENKRTKQKTELETLQMENNKLEKLVSFPEKIKHESLILAQDERWRRA